MHYSDNVDYPRLLTRPGAYLPLLAALFLGLLALHLGTRPGGRELAATFALSSSVTDIILSVAIVAALVANYRVIMRLPLRWQVYLVWAELLIVILVFFYSFNLSFDFIRRKIGFLLAQGLTTTLMISAVSIFIASVLALLGAVAKLFSNGIALGIANFYPSLFRGLPLLMQVYII